MQGGKVSFLMLSLEDGVWGELRWQSAAAESGDCFQEQKICESFHWYLGNSQKAYMTASSQKMDYLPALIATRSS
jgi:hypothetical protein